MTLFGGVGAGSADFRHRASRARQIAEDATTSRDFIKQYCWRRGRCSAIFLTTKPWFQPSDEISRTRYMRDLPAHRDTWGSNIHAQINWWGPVWPVRADRTIGMFPRLWNVPVSNTSAAWSYREFTQHLKADKDTNYPMLPHCADPPPLVKQCLSS